MKRLFSMLVSVCLIASLMSFASADEETRQRVSESAAQFLYSQGLFKGTGIRPDGTPIFDLDKVPTRNQGIIMFIRLLGKEQETLSGNWSFPFTDVPEEMRAYVGYGYANGLTNGTTETTYSGTERITANQYITFILRALGYVSEQDFIVPNASEFAAGIGVDWGEDVKGFEQFTRADLVILSYQALKATLKNSDEILATKIKLYAPADTKRAIVSLHTQMLQVEENGLFSAMTGNYSAAASQFKKCAGYLIQEIELCADYKDTQSAKENLTKLREVYFSMSEKAASGADITELQNLKHGYDDAALSCFTEWFDA